MNLMFRDDAPFAFELFVRNAFEFALRRGYNLGVQLGGERVVQRFGDPGNMADTAAYEVRSVNYIKATAAYCFMIYEQFLLNTYPCYINDESDEDERSFVDEVVEATTKEQVMEIIERFSERYLSDIRPTE